MSHSGYDKQRFINLQFDSFDCIICSQVVVDPFQCTSCGKLFCRECINDWMSKNPAAKCPNRCQSKIIPIFSKALQKLYQSLDIRCINPKCNKVVKLYDLPKHQQICLKVKCWNFQNCEKVQNQSIKCDRPSCSQICTTLYQLSVCFGNKKNMYDIIRKYVGSQGSVNIVKQGSINDFGSNLTNLAWNNSLLGTSVQLSDNNAMAFLKQQAYVFRTVIANIGFSNGKNYWEIIADSRTQNQLKIGVTSSTAFDLNSAFCDYDFGYAYYGLGQLRHGSNASGPSYGKRFKKEGILGVCLNMNNGTLSFALNGEYFGVAYKDNKLKSGTYYPAVSLLHCAGCKIRAGMKVPEYFKD